MRILITGGAGMLGRKLAERLARDGAIGAAPVAELTLADVVEPAVPAGASFEVATRVADVSVPGVADDLVAGRPDVVFHLAAIPSGGAEADFDGGYRVNLDGVRLLLEAIRAQGYGYVPRVVFSSTIAVFGAPFPDAIEDTFHLTPLTCYGSQKAMGELLLTDYTRRGFVDGVGIRLPTVCVRPGHAERGRVGLLLEHHPRAAERARGGAAGRRRGASRPRLAARHDRQSRPRRRHRRRPAGDAGA